MSARVLVTDYAWPSLEIERGILRAVGAELVVAESDEPDELVALAADVDAILTNWRRVPVEALDAAARCLVVARYGVGVDNIPVARATELGMLVANVPDFCVEEVSDHAIALLLASARRIVTFARSTRRGLVDLSDRPRLAAATRPAARASSASVVSRVTLVPKARARARSLAYSRQARRRGATPPDRCRETGDLDHLLATSDYVTLHAPATPDTRE